MARIPKVFIIYPHNPQPYIYTPPTAEEELRRRHPEKSDSEIFEIAIHEAKSIENEVKRRINCHNELVDKFAKFLMANGIDVAYEGLLQDKSTANYMRWFQEQLRTSNFIILIITNSFHHFLFDSKTFPHNGEEQIFEGEFLHNLVHKPNKPLLPVFLGGDSKNLDFLPDALSASSTYHVKVTPDFSLSQSEMDSLYSVLTDQDRCAAPPLGPKVILPQRRRRFGPGNLQQHGNQLMANETYRLMYVSLKGCSQLLNTEAALKLSEKDGFAKHWKLLTRPLHFSEAEVERIEDDPEESERCYNMLRSWMEKERGTCTVAKLAEGVWTHCQNAVMLEIMHSSILLGVN